MTFIAHSFDTVPWLNLAQIPELGINSHKTWMQGTLLLMRVAMYQRQSIAE